MPRASRGDYALMNRNGVLRGDRAQVVDGLGDPHPRRGRRRGEHLDRLTGHEQRVTRMHQPRRVLVVADQMGDVVDHRDLGWMTAWRPPTPPNRQPVDRQFVADMQWHATGRPSSGGGGLSAYSAASGLASPRRAVAPRSAWSGCWWVIRIADSR